MAVPVVMQGMFARSLACSMSWNHCPGKRASRLAEPVMAWTPPQGRKVAAQTEAFDVLVIMTGRWSLFALPPIGY